VSYIFTYFVDFVYKHKANSVSSSHKSTAKSILNNSIARFGLNPVPSVNEIVDEEKFTKINVSDNVESSYPITDKHYLICYEADLSKQVAARFKLDYVKLLQTNVKQSEHLNYRIPQATCVAIPSAVTAYARVYMNKVKLGIINNKGKIVYSDTDSIVCDQKLPSHLVDSKALGKFK